MSQQALPQTCHYSSDDVKIIEKSAGYNGFFKVNVYRLQHRLFAGGWNAPIVRELFVGGQAAPLLPYDPVPVEIGLQFRIGAMETSATPWLLELVAGIIDEGETAEAVVRREAVEEAGIEVGRCEHAISYLVSPGGSTERIEVFVGEVDASQAKGIHGLAEEGEDIRVHVVSREQAYAWLKEGRIDNAASVIALQWLALNHGELRARWLAGR